MRNLRGVEARWEEGSCRSKSKSEKTGMEELPKSHCGYWGSLIESVPCR